MLVFGKVTLTGFKLCWPHRVDIEFKFSFHMLAVVLLVLFDYVRIPIISLIASLPAGAGADRGLCGGRWSQ